MRVNCICAGMMVLFISCHCFSEECPKWSEKHALLQFLLDHKVNSKEADPDCVQRAFSSLSHDKEYITDLVQLLDFERSTIRDEKLMTRSSQYPAIDALARPEALDFIYRSCVQRAVNLLEAEAEKPDITYEQQDRLHTAGQYISEHWGPRPCRND